jgi:hypothetical protein
VKWRNHEKDYADKKANEKLFDRVNVIVELLSLEKSKEFRNLHCRDFFHDSSRFAFDVVFDLSSSTNSTCDTVKLTNLHDLISKTQKLASQFLLEDRLMLAFTLAKFVLKFHMIEWLHKRLSFFNVAFFPTERSFLSKKFMKSYIIGFNHSRLDDQFAFTEGFQDAKCYYQHSAYVKHKSRYRSEFDYYSLDILLLEIGLWNPVDDMIHNIESYFFEKLQKKLVETRTSLLEMIMSVVYRETVNVCLKGDLDANLRDESRLNAKFVHLNFERLMVSRLKKCWSQLADCITLQ